MIVSGAQGQGGGGESGRIVRYGPSPKRVEPSKNSTVPVGEAGPVDAGAMVAVNVTSCPKTGDAGEKETVVDVVACVVVTVTAGEVLAA